MRREPGAPSVVTSFGLQLCCQPRPERSQWFVPASALRTGTCNLCGLRMRRGRQRAAKRELSEANEVHGVAEDAQRLFRGVEAHGIFGDDEVDVVSRASVILLRQRDLLRRGAVGCARLLDVGNQLHQGIHGVVAHIEVARLYLFDPSL